MSGVDVAVRAEVRAAIVGLLNVLEHDLDLFHDNGLPRTLAWDLPVEEGDKMLNRIRLLRRCIHGTPITSHRADHDGL